jgi:hypothetical protein
METRTTEAKKKMVIGSLLSLGIRAACESQHLSAS